MKIAVVTPAYNEEKNILNALKSLINQTVKPVAVVVVNDGSTDNTVVVVKDFIETHKEFFIHLINLPRSKGYGVGYARNLIEGKRWLDEKLIQYDILMILDADQRLSRNYIELCLNAFDDNVAIVGGRTYGTYTVQPRGAHRLLSKWFLDKHPFPLVRSTDSRHYYIALENEHEVKVVKEAIAYEKRGPRSGWAADFGRGVDSYMLGYLFPYLLARALKNMIFRHIKAIFMIYGFLFSFITKKKKYTVCKKISEYQKEKIKNVLLRLLP